MLARNPDSFKLEDFVQELKGDLSFAKLMKSILLEKQPMAHFLPKDKTHVAKEFKVSENENNADGMDSMLVDSICDVYLSEYATPIRLSELFGAKNDQDEEKYSNSNLLKLHVALFMLSANGSPMVRAAFAAFCLRETFKDQNIKIYLHQSNTYLKNFVEIRVGKRKYFFDGTLNPNTIFNQKLFESRILKSKRQDDFQKLPITLRLIDAKECETTLNRAHFIQKAVLLASSKEDIFKKLCANIKFNTAMVMFTTNGRHITEVAIESLARFRKLKPRTIVIPKLRLEEKLIKTGVLDNIDQIELFEFIEGALLQRNQRLRLKTELDVQALIKKLQFNQEENGDLNDDILTVSSDDMLLVATYTPDEYDYKFIDKKSLAMRRQEVEVFSLGLIYKCTEGHSSKAAACFAALRLTKILSEMADIDLIKVEIHHYAAKNRYVVKLIAHDGLTYIYDPDFTAETVYDQKDYEKVILPEFKSEQSGNAKLKNTASNSTLVLAPSIKTTYDFDSCGLEYNEKTDELRETTAASDPNQGRSLREFVQRHGGNEKLVEHFITTFSQYPVNGCDIPSAPAYFSENYRRSAAESIAAAIRINLSSFCMEQMGSEKVITEIFNVDSKQALSDFEHYVLILCSVLMPYFKAGNNLTRAQSGAMMMRAVFDDTMIVRVNFSQTINKYFIEIGNSKIGWYIVDTNLNPNIIFDKDYFINAIHKCYEEKREGPVALFPLARIDKSSLNEFNEVRPKIIAKIISILQNVSVQELLEKEIFSKILSSLGHSSVVHAMMIKAELSKVLSATFVEPVADDVAIPSRLAANLDDFVEKNESNKHLLQQYFQKMREVSPPKKCLPESPNLRPRMNVTPSQDQLAFVLSLLSDHAFVSCLDRTPHLNSLFDKIALNSKYNHYDYLYLGMAITMFDCMQPGNIFMRSAVSAYYLRKMYPDNAVEIRIVHSQVYNVHYVHFGNKKMGWFVLDATVNEYAVFDSSYYHENVLTTYPKIEYTRFIPRITVDSGFCEFLEKNKLSFNLLLANMFRACLTLEKLQNDLEFHCLLSDHHVKGDKAIGVIKPAADYIQTKMKKVFQLLAGIVGVKLEGVAAESIVLDRGTANEEIPEGVSRSVSSKPIALLEYFEKINGNDDDNISARSTELIKKFTDPVSSELELIYAKVANSFISRGVYSHLNGLGGSEEHFVSFYVNALMAEAIPGIILQHTGTTAYAAIKLREIFDEMKEVNVKVAVEYVERIKRFIVVITSPLGRHVYDPVSYPLDVSLYDDYMQNINSILMCVPVSSMSAPDLYYKDLEVTTASVAIVKAELMAMQEKIDENSDAILKDVLEAPSPVNAVTVNRFPFFANLIKAERSVVNHIVQLGVDKSVINGLIQAFLKGFAPLQAHLPHSSHLTSKFKSVNQSEVVSFVATVVTDNCYLQLLSDQSAVLDSLSYPKMTSNDFVIFAMAVYGFTKFSHGDQFARAAYAAFRLRMMIASDNIQIKLKRVPGTNHYIVMIIQGDLHLVYDPTTNPETFYKKEYYLNVIGQAFSKVSTYTEFSMEVMLPVCLSVTGFMKVTNDYLHDLYNKEIQKPKTWSAFSDFVESHFPKSKASFVRDQTMKEMESLIAGMKPDLAAAKLKR